MTYFIRLLLIISACFSTLSAAENNLFWLSWMKDPSSTMTVRWITKTDKTQDNVQYREKGTRDWISISGSHIPMPYKYPYLIHVVELTDLKSGTPYEFRFSEEGDVNFFCTMPDHLTRQIRFVDGGDMYHGDIEPLVKTMRQAAATDPAFVVAGGDLAYSSTRIALFKEDATRWFVFLRIWQETMRAKDGRIIPMVPVIGNHEVVGRYGQTAKEAVFYYALFIHPNTSSNYVLDFGNYMSLIVLDSGHTQTVEGQSKWLEEVLDDRQKVPNKFASYHVPAYPSIRKFEAKVSARIRQNWVPLFEKGHLNAAFEHHDHAYKRTFPLRQGAIDHEDGIIYLGDGAFGVKEPRVSKDLSVKWYLEKAIPSRHFILVTLMVNARSYQAITDEGKVIDQVTR